MELSLRIIVADDEPDTVEFLVEALARLGHQATPAKNGRELVELCRSVRPHLVITDYRMPGLNGLDAVEQVWQEMAVPVVVVSAYCEELRGRAPCGGVIHFLIKPVGLPDLERAVALLAGR